MTFDDSVFRLDYWKVTTALGRAFDRIADGDPHAEPWFWAAVVELAREYPQFDWRNAISDHFHG